MEAIKIKGHTFPTKANKYFDKWVCECGELLGYSVNVKTARANHREHKKSIIRESNR